MSEAPLAPPTKDEAEASYATIDWIDGYSQGHVAGFDQGLSYGRIQGYDDAVYQIKRYLKQNFDPTIEKLLYDISGEES